MCREGLRLAQRDEERRLALAALAGVPDVGALETALPLLHNGRLTEEAGTAVIAIGQQLLPSHPASVIEAMDSVLKSVKSLELLRQFLLPNHPTSVKSA